MQPKESPQKTAPAKKEEPKYAWFRNTNGSLVGAESLVFNDTSNQFHPKTLMRVSALRSADCATYVEFPQVGAFRDKDMLININGQDLNYMPRDLIHDVPNHTFSEKGRQFVMNEFMTKDEINLTYKDNTYVIPTNTFEGALNIVKEDCQKALSDAKTLKERKSSAL
ncbi:hypothetical protein A9267_21125 [Shewanella sp. UCD-FRSSP16_17]|nr:hypothetical protein A9267_21125 [Shewanella sp. UCD-FRSSP16_17]